MIKKVTRAVNWLANGPKKNSVCPPKSIQKWLFHESSWKYLIGFSNSSYPPYQIRRKSPTSRRQFSYVLSCSIAWKPFCRNVCATQPGHEWRVLGCGASVYVCKEGVRRGERMLDCFCKSAREQVKHARFWCKFRPRPLKKLFLISEISIFELSFNVLVPRWLFLATR